MNGASGNPLIDAIVVSVLAAILTIVTKIYFEGRKDRRMMLDYITQDRVTKEINQRDLDDLKRWRVTHTEDFVEVATIVDRHEKWHERQRPAAAGGAGHGHG